MSINQVLVVLNFLAFAYYGLNCLFSPKMVEEFYRYGLNDPLRRLTGILQVLGSFGVILGLYAPLIGLISTAGLTLLMLLGFGVRIKIRDSFVESLPSFAFMGLNAYLFYHFFQQL